MGITNGDVKFRSDKEVDELYMIMKCPSPINVYEKQEIKTAMDHIRHSLEQRIGPGLGQISEITPHILITGVKAISDAIIADYKINVVYSIGPMNTYYKSRNMRHPV